MSERSLVHPGDEMLRRLAAALRAVQLYSKGHPLIARNLEALETSIHRHHEVKPALVIGILDDEIIVDETPLKGDAHAGLVHRLKQISVERITVDRGVATTEIAAFIDAISSIQPRPDGAPPAFPALPHIRVGQVSVDTPSEAQAIEMDGLRRIYSDAVTVAENVWESARHEGRADATAARTMVDGLAQAVSQNRTALLALTALKNYDNYTFTHMVNVSLLTMGQAKALGIDGALLREFGLAALMHDIGKVRTPLDILNKPEKLTDLEFQIMQRHTVEGAEILRGTPDVPTLAPIVAFEHHLRIDGSGYPQGVGRSALNLGTMLCSIADVYDAMRSQRKYQQSFPTDRILEVLRRNDGHQFDQHLVRRFIQLIGIYPAGNLVRLDTGETAVVVKPYAPDPHRPQVRIIADASGHRLERPHEINLWEGRSGNGPGTAIAAPVDPQEMGIDPLTLL